MSLDKALMAKIIAFILFVGPLGGDEEHRETAQRLFFTQPGWQMNR